MLGSFEQHLNSLISFLSSIFTQVRDLRIGNYSKWGKSFSCQISDCSWRNHLSVGSTFVSYSSYLGAHLEAVVKDTHVEGLSHFDLHLVGVKTLG